MSVTLALEALANASMERYADEIKTIKPKFFVEKPVSIKKSYSNNNNIDFIRRVQSDVGPSSTAFYQHSNTLSNSSPNNKKMNVGISTNNNTNWHLQLSSNDILLVKTKIKTAYMNQIPIEDQKLNSIIELIDLCVLIENDLLLKYSPSRLDYIKNGVQYHKIVLEKKKQLLDLKTKSETKCESTSCTSISPIVIGNCHKRSLDNTTSTTTTSIISDNSDIDQNDHPNKKSKLINDVVSTNNTTTTTALTNEIPESTSPSRSISM